MRPSFWATKDASGTGPQANSDSTLDPVREYKPLSVTRCFSFTDLWLRRAGTTDTFNLELELQREGSENSGKSQNPVPPLLLRFQIQAKEVQLATGLLGRPVEIEEVRSTSTNKVEELNNELSQLREEHEEALKENQALKRYLMETQRLTRAS